MATILFTLAEDTAASSDSQFALKYSVDEYDCLDFARALTDLQHDVFFVNWRDLRGDTFERVFSFKSQQYVQPMACSQFALAFVYKMEGFLFDISTFLSMVALFEKNCPIVINHPKTIRHNIDKSYLWDLEREGVRIIPTYAGDSPSLSAKLDAGTKFVVKPRCGERGNGIFMAETNSDLQKMEGKSADFIVQEYMPAIRNGERSLVYVGHVFQHAVLKKPSVANTAEFRCNESLGGTVEIYQPSVDELNFAAGVLKVYEQRLGCPIHFSRVDLIDVDGPILMEAELLNPSIYANYAKRAEEFARAFAAHLDALLPVGLQA